MVTIFLAVLYMCIYVSIGYICADVHRGVRASGDGILSAVNHPTWVVEPKVKPSGSTGGGELSRTSTH